ncbi:MAG: hypothetical protein OXD43_04820 [Bacteroidetes bacterium]|nr:hypothetical protein [Bacteroidota bacterium]
MTEFRNLLQEETAFYEKNREALLLQYPNRVLLIHGDKLQGDFLTVDDAVTEGVRRFGSGPFLVRKSGEEEPVVSVPALTLGLL